LGRLVLEEQQQLFEACAILASRLRQVVAALSNDPDLASCNQLPTKQQANHLPQVYRLCTSINSSLFSDSTVGLGQ
jgi:hypothetical protein